MPRLHWPYAILTVLYCAGIFFLSSQPNLSERAPSWLNFANADKLTHVMLYAGLAGLFHVGLTRSNPQIRTATRQALPVLFATVYGLSDEIHQLFVPNRTFDLLDLLADGLGATICVIVLEAWWRWRAHGGTLARERP